MGAIGDWGAVGTAVAAGVGLLYAGNQIRSARQIAQRDMVYRYMDRLNDPDFQPLLAAAREFWSAPTAEDQELRWKEWLELDTLKRHRIVLPLNIYEELATMYLQKVVDRHVVAELLGSSSLSFWSRVEWLVKRLREEKGRPVLCDWEKMNEDLRKHRGAG